MSEQNNTEQQKKGPFTVSGCIWDPVRPPGTAQDEPQGEPVDPGQVRQLQEQVDALRRQLAAVHAGEWGRDALQQKVAALEAQLAEMKKAPPPKRPSIWVPVDGPSMMKGRTRR